MTKTQANALMNALETQKMSATARMIFDQAGNENWNVELDPTVIYTGAQLSQLTTYCTQNGLALSIVVSQMGVT